MIACSTFREPVVLLFAGFGLHAAILAEEVCCGGVTPNGFCVTVNGPKSCCLPVRPSEFLRALGGFRMSYVRRFIGLGRMIIRDLRVL